MNTEESYSPTPAPEFPPIGKLTPLPPVPPPVQPPNFWALFPMLLGCTLVSTALSLLLFWAIGGSMWKKVESQQESFRTEKGEVRRRLAKAESATSDLIKQGTAVQEQIIALKEEKKELRVVLETTAEKLGTAQEGLLKITTQLTKYADDQEHVDAGQNAEITKVSNRLTYIERRVKSLEALEADVMGLKNDTGNLKGQYVVLKNDLELVRKKGDVTHKELEDLGERSRLFQLRVLAARAREAAEAARQGDLKKLLARLSEAE